MIIRKTLSTLRLRGMVGATLSTLIHLAVVCSVNLMMGGCAAPDISISSPKVYTDDQVLKTLGERRRVLAEKATAIKAAKLHEVFGARQATQVDTNVSVSPATADLLSAPSPVESGDVVLPEAPTIGGNLGPTFASQLKNTTTQDQLITGLDLLYLGDSQLLDNGKRAVLLRFDVSVNNYLDGTDWMGDKRFALVGFRVRALGIEEKDITVYTLAPEYSSVKSQESLATAQIESYAAQGGGTVEGFNIQGAGRFQRAFEELLSTLTDHPIQFASYDNRPNRFAFAFGPRRKIEKDGGSILRGFLGTHIDLTMKSNLAQEMSTRW